MTFTNDYTFAETAPIVQPAIRGTPMWGRGNGQKMSDQKNAALLVIGDEILSGRTQDKNLSYLATWLNEAGIQLLEARIVPDDQGTIVAAVNALRAEFDYVFTTGGIGPTHDDITAECVARAFERPLTIHPEAYRRLEEHYGAAEFTKARQRMAHTPEGADLIDNPVSIAPGFQVENVFVMAGVPKIMQAMLETIRPRLKTGRKVLSQALTIHTPESRMADALGDIQAAHEGVSVGSYPFFRDGSVGTQIVVRSLSEEKIEKALSDLRVFCTQSGYRFDEV